MSGARAVIVLDRRLRAQLDELIYSSGASYTVESLAASILQTFVVDLLERSSDLVDELDGSAGWLAWFGRTPAEQGGGLGLLHRLQVNTGVESQIETVSSLGHV